MENPYEQKIQTKVKDLIDHFDEYLAINEEHTPFTNRKQLDIHRRIIKNRIEAGSAIKVIDDVSFLSDIYEMLHAWGMDQYKKYLLPFPKFKETLQSKAEQIAKFDGIKIDDPNLEISDISKELWELIYSLGIVSSETKIVTGTKTLHHLLPELIVPIDRTYTGIFFDKNQNSFQKSQEFIFHLAFENFVKIAKATRPEQYVGKGWWNTCQTKIIDNAIIGYQIKPHYEYLNI